MSAHHRTHNDLHSEPGALPADHPGRARNPVIKVLDLAWLEFVKPDLVASEHFAHAFGFTTVNRTGTSCSSAGPTRAAGRGCSRWRPAKPSTSGSRTVGLRPHWC